MKTYKKLYQEITAEDNLILAFQKARKRKSKKEYVQEFSQNLKENLSILRTELLLHTYQPKPLETFMIRDPKTRKISKSDFRDRIVHHALCNVIEPIFDSSFIYDSYANRKGKGSLAALQRFDVFKRKISRNGKTNGWFNNNQIKGYCLKADIKHYFEEVDHKILLKIINKKITCPETLCLIEKILSNHNNNASKGMPLGNLTSQFFANIYLNELDQFIKHHLKIRYYIRYVDDFVILHSSKKQLRTWKDEINLFLQKELKIELHPDKTRIISLNKPLPFVGFRVFYHYKLLKKFNQKSIQSRLNKFYNNFLQNKIDYDKIYESMQGSFAYMKHAQTYILRIKLADQIEKNFSKEVSYIEVNRYLKWMEYEEMKKRSLLQKPYRKSIFHKNT